MAPSDPGLETGLELPMGMARLPGSLWGVQGLRAMLPQALPALGEVVGPDRELPTFTNAGEDWLQTDNGDEKQQIPLW